MRKFVSVCAAFGALASMALWSSPAHAKGITHSGVWTGPVHYTTGLDDTYTVELVDHGDGAVSGTEGILTEGTYEALVPIAKGQWVGDAVAWTVSRDEGFQYDKVEGRLVGGVLSLNITTYEQGKVLATGTATLHRR